MGTTREWLSLPMAEPAEDYGFFGPDRVFGEGRSPSDAGIIESEPILGTVG